MDNLIVEVTTDFCRSLAKVSSSNLEKNKIRTIKRIVVQCRKYSGINKNMWKNTCEVTPSRVDLILMLKLINQSFMDTGWFSNQEELMVFIEKTLPHIRRDLKTIWFS